MPTYKMNSERKVYCIDYDHVLTADEPGVYSDNPEPEYNMVKAVNRLFFAGNIIIIWTNRQWGDASFLASWLTKHKVPYHGIKMEKGGADIYVDDRMVAVQEILKEV